MMRFVTPAIRFAREWPLHLITVMLVIAVLVIAPRQAGILVYKAALLLIAAVGAYWINRLLFFREPHGEDIHDRWQMTTMICAAMLAAGLAA